MVYGTDREAPEPLYLGSVKSQIGHLKAAAGVAGLIKTVLAMNEGKIPHLPRFTKLTPGATLPSEHLAIPTEIKPWNKGTDGKRVSAVTTSGFGGVNYHAIIEQGDSYTRPQQRPEIPHEVAIVGVQVRVAGADTPEKFWENMTEGVDVFTDVDPKDHGWEDCYETGPQNEIINTNVVCKVEPYKMNLLRHKIFPNAVSQISPTQLLGLDLADKLLTSAGFALEEPKKIGVSIGCMHDDYFPTIFMPMITDEYIDALHVCASAGEVDASVLKECCAIAKEEIRAEFPPVTEHTLPGWMTNVTAGRIANKLNLHGPNFTVDSACSSGIASSLPAMYQLMYGNVDMMISGGLNRQLSDTFTTGVCALGAVAKRVARPFDKDGTGYLIGEGGVLFLLSF
jgi:acyl transferase domain-containing protein